MASRVFAVVGIVLFVFVCIAIPMVSVDAISDNASKARCELVDSWLKPKGELLSKHWDETVGADCSGNS